MTQNATTSGPSAAQQVTNIQVRDVRVRVHRAGSGEPLLFLHGAGGVPAWLPFFDMLAARFGLLVPEHPGFDGSDDPDWIRNVPDLAMFYLDFVESLGLDGIHLVGTSLGGWIAAEILVRNSTRFKSAVLLAPAGIRVHGVPAGADNFIWGPEEGIRNLYHDQMFAEALLALTPTEDQVGTRLKNLYTVTKLGWQPLGWYSPDLEKWLHRITVPTCVLWGNDE